VLKGKRTRRIGTKLAVVRNTTHSEHEQHVQVDCKARQRYNIFFTTVARVTVIRSKFIEIPRGHNTSGSVTWLTQGVANVGGSVREIGAKTVRNTINSKKNR
jgi:hypothetical protein